MSKTKKNYDDDDDKKKEQQLSDYYLTSTEQSFFFQLYSIYCDLYSMQNICVVSFRAQNTNSDMCNVCVWVWSCPVPGVQAHVSSEWASEQKNEQISIFLWTINSILTSIADFY